MMEKLKQFIAKLSKRERLILYATGLVLLLGAMDRIVYQPVLNLFEELDQEIGVQENQLRKNLRFLAIREAVQSRYAAIAGHAIASGGDEEEIGGLLNEIEVSARNSGLSLVNMKPKPVAATESGKLYPVEVEVETTMAQLIKFIYGLYRSRFILGVKKLQLTPQGGGSDRIKGYLLINKTAIG